MLQVICKHERMSPYTHTNCDSPTFGVGALFAGQMSSHACLCLPDWLLAHAVVQLQVIKSAMTSTGIKISNI
jgi:hypothetical protein